VQEFVHRSQQAYLEQRIDTTMTATLLMKAEQAVPDRWVKS
jgi:hypothetical protein